MTYNLSEEIGEMLVQLQTTLSNNAPALLTIAAIFVGINFTVELLMRFMPWNRRNSSKDGER